MKSAFTVKLEYTLRENCIGNMQNKGFSKNFHILFNCKIVFFLSRFTFVSRLLEPIFLTLFDYLTDAQLQNVHISTQQQGKKKCKRTQPRPKLCTPIWQGRL